MKSSENVQQETIGTEPDDIVTEVAQTSSNRDHSMSSESREPNIAEVSPRSDWDRNYYEIKWFKRLLALLPAFGVVFGFGACIWAGDSGYDVVMVARTLESWCLATPFCLYFWTLLCLSLEKAPSVRLSLERLSGRPLLSVSVFLTASIVPILSLAYWPAVYIVCTITGLYSLISVIGCVPFRRLWRLVRSSSTNSTDTAGLGV